MNQYKSFNWFPVKELRDTAGDVHIERCEDDEAAYYLVEGTTNNGTTSLFDCVEEDDAEAAVATLDELLASYKKLDKDYVAVVKLLSKVLRHIPATSYGPRHHS